MTEEQKKAFVKARTERIIELLWKDYPVEDVVVTIQAYTIHGLAADDWTVDVRDLYGSYKGKERKTNGTIQNLLG